MYYLIKVILTAILIVVISEAAKRWSLLGAVLASIPLTSLLAMIWLYLDTGNRIKIAELTISIFWMVLPSLTFFVCLFILLKKTEWSFWVSIGLSIFLTSISYFIYLKILSKLGIRI